MRRAAITITMALVALVALPGAALAAPVGDLDAGAALGSGRYTMSGADVTQTVTAETTGVLTEIQLYCAPLSAASVGVAVTVGTSTGGGLCNPSDDWVRLYVNVPVTAGQQYTLHISAPGLAGTVALGVAAADYAGGAAAESGSPISLVSDFAFVSYVLATSSTTYTWNPTQVHAGTSTAASLSAATTFHELPVSNSNAVTPDAARLPDNFYTVKLGSLPAWFTPSSITCSAQVAPADCTLAQFQAGIHPAGNGSAMTVTIVIDGLAAPALADAGSAGNAAGRACITVPADGDPYDVCDLAQAGLGVSGPGVTAPPTTTLGSPASTTGSGAWLLWAGLAGLAGLGAVLLSASVRRSHIAREP